MGRQCRVCNHDQRAGIDKEIVENKNLSEIARKYDISRHSLDYHAKNHISKGLAKAYKMKKADHNLDLLNRVEAMLEKSEKIFDRNYDRDSATGDKVALRAISEHRQTLELLANMAAYLNEIKRAENSSQEDHKRYQVTQKELNRLTDRELELLALINLKLAGEFRGKIFENLPEPKNKYDFEDAEIKD